MAANPYATGGDANPFAEDVVKTAAPVPPPEVAAAPMPAAAPAPAPVSVAPAPQQFYDPSPASANPAYTPAPVPGVPPAGQPYVMPEHQAGAVPAVPQPGQPLPPGQQPPPSTAIPEARDLQTAKVWTIEYYQQFFNVDSRQVCQRLACALIPFTPPDFLKARNWHFGQLPCLSAAASNFTGDVETMPDMYGPFWVTTTLWITVGIVGNLMSKIAHYRSTKSDKGSWHYDFREASVACATFYAYVVLMSLCVWGVMKWKAAPATIVDTIAIFGYSMTPICLGAILCGIPSIAFQWIVCLVCGLWSLMFVLLNFWRLWNTTMGPQYLLGFAGFVSVCHILLTMSLKFYFFNYKI